MATTKFRFVYESSGAPCSDEFNQSVSALFDEYPVFQEVFLIEDEVFYRLIQDILNGRTFDWNSRSAIINVLSQWENPKVQSKVNHVLQVLKQNNTVA